MKELKQLIEEGIIIEDDFIETYMNVVKDELSLGFLDAEKQKILKEKLEYMIKESREHKQILENVIEKYNLL